MSDARRAAGVAATALPGLLLVVHLLFFLSGFTALVYQILWMRRLVLVFGATTFAVSTVLTAFMTGLAVGSWGLGRLVDRLPRPLLAYGLMEIGIGLYAAFLPLFLDGLIPVYRAVWLRFEPGVLSFALLKFVGSMAVLVVPTTLMGGSLPALARWAMCRSSGAGRPIGVLYAWNTLGGAVGTLACGFVLIRVLGVAAVSRATAVTSVVLGGIALWIAWRAPRRAGPTAPSPPARAPAPEGAAGARSGRVVPVLVGFGLSGCAALVLEVAWTRVLTLILGGSVYAFALMLAVFLTGLATGAAVVSRVVDRPGRRPEWLLAGLLTGAGLAAIGSLCIFGLLPGAFARLFQLTGGSRWVLPVAGFALCATVMAPATLFLGGIFPVVIRLTIASGRQVGAKVGRAYAANTVGTIVGAFVGGFIAVPWFGLERTILLAGAIEIGVGAMLALVLGTGSGRARLLAVAAVMAVAVTLAAGRPPWNALLMNSGMYLYAAELPAGFDARTFRDYTQTAYRELFYREGAIATVLVGEERANGNRFLSVNGKVDASTGADMQTQVLSGQLPLLLHPAPRDVLVVGLASGVTAGSVATHPVKQIDIMEIEAAVIEASRLFDAVNNRPLDDPRVHVLVGDGRNSLLFTDRRYDVIISEPSNPWLSGAANLFTREYFDIVARRLAPGGIACQWIQAYSMGLDDLRSLLASFHDVFPHLLVFDLDATDLLILGSSSPLALDRTGLRERMHDLDVALDLARVGIRAPADLLAWFAFGEGEASSFAAGAGLNTDDNARIEFSAPWSLYDQTRERNRTALSAATVDVESYLAHPPPAGSSGRFDLNMALATALYRRGATRRAARRVEEALRQSDTPAARELAAAIGRRVSRSGSGPHDGYNAR
ncbi:MAG: fused MFS/spermidine synthase [Acidobacteriota bacterium]